MVRENNLVATRLHIIFLKTIAMYIEEILSENSEICFDSRVHA